MYIQYMIGVLAARNNLKVKNARQPVERYLYVKVKICEGQGHKNKQT